MIDNGAAHTEIRALALTIRMDIDSAADGSAAMILA